MTGLQQKKGSSILYFPVAALGGSCWVPQFILSNVYSSLPVPAQSGWMSNPDDVAYDIEWEASEAQEKMKSTIIFIKTFWL